MTSMSQSGTGADAQSAGAAAWPHCPKCGKPRLACCPFCGQVGKNFAYAATPLPVVARTSAAPNAIAGPQVNMLSVPRNEASDASCKGEGCSATTPSQHCLKTQEDADHSLFEALAVICPTCDEPHFARMALKCEWCDHHFGGGVEFSKPTMVTNPLPTARLALVVLALCAVVASIVAYFAWIGRSAV